MKHKRSSTFTYFNFRVVTTSMSGFIAEDGRQRRDEEEEKRVGCGGSREKKNEELRFGPFGRLK